MAIVATLVTPSEKVTALSIMNRARRLIGVNAADTPMEADEASDCFSALNGMIDRWANDRLMFSALSEDVVTLIGGQTAYTIGEGADIDTRWPTDISPATFIRSNNIDYPVQILTAQQYNAIPLKNFSTSIPNALWYQKDYPIGMIHLYPAPTGAALHLWSVKPFVAFSAPTNEVVMQPGARDALSFNLAVVLAPEYGVEAPPTVKTVAITSKKSIKRVNFDSPQLGFRAEVLPTVGFNIYKGS